MDSGVSLDVLDIRPEDIRVEPGVQSHPSPTPAPWVPPRPAPVETAAPDPPPVFAARDPAPPATYPPAREPEPGPAAAEPVLPAIRLDSAPQVNTNRQTLPARPRDLILPRSVVAAWSTLVLVAVAFAFLTGLLAGHFVWKVH